jgi:hypothetical protein
MNIRKWSPKSKAPNDAIDPAEKQKPQGCGDERKQDFCPMGIK